MKSIKLTQKILDGLKPSTILYAEYATDGAMGCAGSNPLLFFMPNMLPMVLWVVLAPLVFLL